MGFTKIGIQVPSMLAVACALSLLLIMAVINERAIGQVLFLNF